MTFTPEQIQKAKLTTFYCDELGKEVTIGDWWKAMMLELNREEEGFSGKRPLGNSSWKHDAQIALVQAGLIEGEIDEEEGYLNDIDDRGCDALFDAVIRSLA